MHRMLSWCQWRSEEGIGSPEIGVMDSYKPPYGFWEVNLVLVDPLEEQVLPIVKLSHLFRPLKLFSSA